MESKEELLDVWIDEVKKLVLERMDSTQCLSDEDVREIIWQTIELYSRQHVLMLSEREHLGKEVFHALRRLDIIQELVDDPQITEIMVNGGGRIFYEKRGRLYQWERSFTSEERLQNVVQQIVGNSNRMVNELHPIVDTRLANGSRVNIVLKPIAIDGTALSIRRFPDHPVNMKQLLLWDSLSAEVLELLRKLVVAGYNIFVSGGTGSGKTTFLNALSEYIPRSERIVTIEDSAELQIRGIPNIVRLESRMAKLEGAQEISIRDLIRSALRMRPNRIIVGECRGPEALDVLQAMNTGHDGSLSTGHANSAKDMISRIETMVLMDSMQLPIEAIRGQIASGIDIVIHLGRLRDGSRKLLQVAEIDGIEDGRVRLRTLFQFQEQGEENGRIKGTWEKKEELLYQEKLYAAGL